MPYNWMKTGEDAPAQQELHLWPHQSLPPRGYAWFIGGTFALILLPVIGLLGTALLWGILPFVMIAIAGIWFALDRSRRNAQILEILTLSDTTAHLLRLNPRGVRQEWKCNRYWVRPEMHDSNGPVPYYVTLHGGGREVEIGAFLSEDERVALFDELSRKLPPRN
ncbi:DUF2244 domain-containing protein [Pontibaca salina]|uniref:DUF2244 domain-containing protein n=1 Tax=Pontibaca salina TaxID=2795731 RepID=A0A934HW07_9RHOB|nr:DUF2244 domain-containing protein [Pontibaca salina]MBI6630549.1 DUF2244 domain-containing protein [Pontibaca salina]